MYYSILQYRWVTVELIQSRTHDRRNLTRTTPHHTAFLRWSVNWSSRRGVSVYYYFIVDDIYFLIFIISISNVNLWYKINRVEISEEGAGDPPISLTKNPPLTLRYTGSTDLYAWNWNRIESLHNTFTSR